MTALPVVIVKDAYIVRIFTFFPGVATTYRNAMRVTGGPPQ